MIRCRPVGGRPGPGTLPTALLALLVLTQPAAAQRLADIPWWERYYESTSEYYVIKTDLPRSEARSIARHLDRMYEEYSRRLASLPQRAPVKLNVLLFQSRRDYELTLRARFGVNAAGTGGLFFVNGPNHGLALWTERLSDRRIRHVIQHEGFHQFAWSRFGGDLPNWLNEGLAEFFGLSVLVGDRLIIGQSHERTLQRLNDAIERETYLPFGEMISMSNERWMSKVNGGDAALMYDQAWSMVHFLVYAGDGRYVEALERYLRLINNGMPSEDAFLRAFDTTETDAFEQRWAEFVLRTRPSAFVTALERIEFLAEGTMELARREIYPSSLESLRESLQSIDFTYTLGGHSRLLELDAHDESLYVLPGDDRTTEPPAFAVSRPNLRRLLLRQRKLEEAHPSPSSVGTEHLEPKELGIVWRRDDEDPDLFTYQIRVR